MINVKSFSLLCAMIICWAPTLAKAADPLPRIITSGNQYETPEGKPVHLRGVSLCSLDWHKPLDLLKEVTTQWKPNVVRLPVQPKEWKLISPEKYLSQRLDPAVKICREQGVYCIIDWHQIDSWDKPEKTKELENFWKIVAPRYATNTNIIYEVFNEPTNPGVRTRENWIKFREKMQLWVDQIRRDAPHTLLLIGSPNWSQLPAFAVEDPVVGNNLAYVMHAYPGNFGPKTWDKFFGNAAKSIPIFMSEWGWTDNEKAFYVIKGTQQEFGEPLKKYFNERPHIGWTAWSYDPKCGPAMKGKDKDMGDFVKQWLDEIDTAESKD
jgi:endoglucanase